MGNDKEVQLNWIQIRLAAVYGFPGCMTMLTLRTTEHGGKSYLDLIEAEEYRRAHEILDEVERRRHSE